MAALLAVLGSIPALARTLPTHDVDLTAAQLRSLVRASDDVGWSGYGESRVDLPLPDVPDLGEVPGLLGGTTRSRAVWRGPQDWRVDQLLLAGEIDTIQQPGGTLSWRSAEKTVTVVNGELPVRLPRAADLIAPVLGRRLVATPDTNLSRLPERRIAGRTAAGLRVTPRDPAATTVESVDLWVEPDTGLPLQVEVRTAGQRNPVLTSLLLDLDLSTPSADRTTFTPPPDAQVSQAEAPDIAAEIDRFAPYLLPPALAGSDRQNPVSGLGNGGVAVYGTGFQAYAVVPLSGGVANRVLDAAEPGGTFSTTLVNGLVGRDRRRVYLLVGTVPPATLKAGLDQLIADPPLRVNG